ncbi:putative RNA-binding protein CG14230 isoform X2 [Rhynchophorus ferrugineus]|uniref:putative RNA-binding protein CG14230 isoform X2 n=1 Tax=Rhynchophorus ferrugineus TaxID=354439 RepID=UPI003FCC3003
MKAENQRIFISDLPETLTEDELRTTFSNYGQVSSIEIKERKELGPKNKSLFFAYINLVTDHSDLNKCFKDISSQKWHGQYVHLQIARESFLERLKREREENLNNNSKNEEKPLVQHPKIIQSPTSKQNGQVNKKKTVYKSSSESESEEDVKKPVKLPQNNTKKAVNESSSESSSDSEPEKDTKKHLKLHEVLKNNQIDIVIKNNKHKYIDKNTGLKIPSVGKKPIIEITKNKATKNNTEANIKRLQSLQNMKKGYNIQQNLIREALSNVDNKANKKIVFNGNNKADSLSLKGDTKQNSPHQRLLFDNDSESENEIHIEDNFKVKEQFQGKSGQKLLELQSKYKNDKRFKLDERFIEDKDQDEAMETEPNLEEALEAEKDTQLKILEEVIGKKVRREQTVETKNSDSAKRKTMRRFDPTQPEHMDLEIKGTETGKKIKTKEKTKPETRTEVETNIPEVSKEVFYRVTNDLKETFEDKEQFSLLGAFGRADSDREFFSEADKEEEEGASNGLSLNSSSMLKSKNPFKYDSSDDEDETEDIPHKSLPGAQVQSTEATANKSQKSIFWTESFFFKNDDYRLQEGADFLEKIKGENREFDKVRRELKGIVKAKIRNTARKNKMFKKKLGGNKKKSQLRIKKALKR